MRDWSKSLTLYFRIFASALRESAPTHYSKRKGECAKLNNVRARFYSHGQFLRLENIVGARRSFREARSLRKNAHTSSHQRRNRISNAGLARCNATEYLIGIETKSRHRRYSVVGTLCIALRGNIVATLCRDDIWEYFVASRRKIVTISSDRVKTWPKLDMPICYENLTTEWFDDDVYQSVMVIGNQNVHRNVYKKIETKLASENLFRFIIFPGVLMLVNLKQSTKNL